MLHLLISEEEVQRLRRHGQMQDQRRLSHKVRELWDKADWDRETFQAIIFFNKADPL